jgi:RimJ/RimL family protein N-acetyltransferase
MKISLRDVEDADLEIFHAFEQDPEAVRRSRFPARERERFMTHWREKILGDPGTFVQTVTADGAPAGNILTWWQGERRFLGYWLGREFWGRGVGTWAVDLFLRAEPVRPLYADPHEGNTASVRLLERLGFRREGLSEGHITLVLDQEDKPR